MCDNCGVLRTILIATLISVATVPASARDDRTAVPLRSPEVATPVETAGTGLAPEVTVRVRVDTAGRVGKVDVLSIRPSSEFDELFRQVTRETLSKWRYAPEIFDGVPIVTVLEWTIQFPSRDEPMKSERPEATPGGRSWSAEPPASLADRRWKQILGMSANLQAKLLDEAGGRAEAHLEKGSVRRVDSQRFIVFTDSPRDDSARQLAGNLEATFEVVHDLLQPKIEPLPDRHKLVAFMYASRTNFEALRREAFSVEWAAGFYNPVGLIAFHMQMSTNQELVSLMLHEATHAYVDRYIARRGVLIPRWLGEGFADYVGNSRIQKGKLIPGKTPRAQIMHTTWGDAIRKSEAAYTVQQVKLAMGKGTALSLEKLMTADMKTFYGDEYRMFYRMSWLLVHFLRHGNADWADGEFPTFFLYVAEGYPVAESFEAVYGKPMVEFESEFRNYVKKF